jgi:dihydroorotate dehydrogenase electron transfer subunit
MKIHPPSARPHNDASNSLPPRATRVAERIQENHNTISLVLDTGIPAVPGQFAMLWLPGLDEKPFGISGAGPAMFTIARVGPFSEALHELEPGDFLWFRGPFGRGFTVGSADAIAGRRPRAARGPMPGRPVLVGGGYGAAPLYFLARELSAEKPKAAPLIALGARTAADLLFIRRFEKLGLEVRVSTEDGSAGFNGLVTDLVMTALDAGEANRIYACGPGAMLSALAAICRSAGIPAELSHEAYMRCGIGLCGSCEHEGMLVCMDGPVLSA